MELIDKAAVVAEMERIISLYKAEKSKEDASKVDKISLGARIAMLEEIISFINSLEVKEMDLEDEATKYAQDKYMPVQTAEAFRAGYNKCRQEMMNSAIEREIKVDAGGYPYIDATELYDYDNDKPLAKAGDKVKVLIIKE